MATPTTPIRLPGDPLPPPPEPRYPWRVGVTMLGLVVLVLVVVWLAFQAVKGPPTAGQFPSPATATAIERNFEATVSAADTAQPRPTPRPTPQPATQAPVVPTSAPAAVAAPAVAPVATSQPATTAPGSAAGSSGGVIATVSPPTATNAAAQVPAPAPASVTEAASARTTTALANGSGNSVTPTPYPTVDPELNKEVSDAYTRYWQVVADTALSLDPAPLEQVAAGEQLSVLERNLADDSTNNRATQVKVQHDFVIVSADDNQAEVADQLRDASIVVDATTHEPLPGQAQAPSLDTVPPINAIVDLRRINGDWKVVTAGKAIDQESAP